ncbi:MAG TPA: RNA-binding protein [Candidatus Paceibacterota bacterium]
MATKLYVGSLSYNTGEDSLKEVFSQAGEVVSATVIIDKVTGRARGFGFVEMADDASAQKAIEMFNGYELDGRKLIVNEARPMTERPRGGGGGFRGGHGGGGRGFGGGDRY